MGIVFVIRTKWVGPNYFTFDFDRRHIQYDGRWSPRRFIAVAGVLARPWIVEVVRVGGVVGTVV